ncbi:GNAT family N-acetyltransferase [Pseudoalteromonas piscicida]|uniref:GNAT family N-acetyltransferase n=1 Tax=Pseudoalteromonas piscicida TaxID=43662 RepID=A0AAD0W6N6_PSEO7|nr:GNAT family N-acetyltransferase [Pseudoalteromonas piscicida]ASD69713.1 GNAT family N-acetyltransferase [Pseudoalteromonas piscicida]AXR04791.1 GNAT family N-acetyltransferase [Pseudoalteromonas piscicida]
MEFKLLAQHKALIPIIAKWYFDEWGSIVEEASVERFEQKLLDYLNESGIPCVIIALDGDKIAGAVQLKFHEMSIYTDKEHWIGGVYVDKPYRGNKLASRLVKEAEQLAIKFGVKTLYLQTEHPEGGLYRKLGWQPLENVNYRGVDVVVMSKTVG